MWYRFHTLFGGIFMKLCQKLITKIILIVFLMIFFSACGRGNGHDEHDQAHGSPQEEPQELVLTMASSLTYAPILWEAEQQLRTAISQSTDFRYRFRLQLTTYSLESRDDFLQRFNIMFMAGDGYDLFVVDDHPLINLSRNGMIADIYEMIDNDPNVIRDDFYTNILEAFEYQGQLLSIPLHFGFTYVGINASLPQSIQDRFAASGDPELLYAEHGMAVRDIVAEAKKLVAAKVKL